MFYERLSALTRFLRPEAVPPPRVAGLRAARAEADAARAMTCECGDMPLSERLRSPNEYLRLQRKRRECLEALLSVEPTPELARRAADLICMIVEESTWSANPEQIPFDDEGHPQIDLQCAETVALLGWTQRALGSALREISPKIPARMLSEARRRAFKPLLAHEDYAFMRGEAPCSLATVVGLALGAILLEDDEARTMRVLKPAARILDDLCARRGRDFRPLTDVVTDVSAVADFVGLLSEVTHGALCLADRVPPGEWLDEILFAWVHDDWFIDPAGDDMKPTLSGSDVFRAGLIGGDDALTALGAKVYHRSHLPPRTVTGRLLELSLCERLEAQAGAPPKLRYAALPRNRLMSARVPGLYCAMHVGGGRQNAGDLCLFSADAPILIDGGRACPARNLPLLANRAQLNAPSQPCIADFEQREDREMMSVDLTHAYPDACRLRSYQRTVLTLRAEQSVRIVDALAFDEPAQVTFSFVSAARTTLLTNAVRLGSVRMTWEGGFTVSAHSLPDGLTQLQLTCPEPVSQALFSFVFERA